MTKSAGGKGRGNKHGVDPVSLLDAPDEKYLAAIFDMEDAMTEVRKSASGPQMVSSPKGKQDKFSLK